MQKKINITVIVTTYNWPNALDLVLMGLAHQNDLDFEVIIADDGSTEETKKLIDCYQSQLKFPLIHVWQEDAGFRASQIRNKAAAQAQGEYLIFLDGDCIPLVSFIQRHRELLEPGWMVSGNRILLNAQFTQKVLKNKLQLFQWTVFRWTLMRVLGKCNRILPLMSLSHESEFRKRKPCEWQGVKTCNFGVWKEDFFSVNGFDEVFQGWGFEDSDLVVRLINNGITRKEGRCAVPVIHLWHQERKSSPDNFEKLQYSLQHKAIRSELGVNQYLRNQ